MEENLYDWLCKQSLHKLISMLKQIENRFLTVSKLRTSSGSAKIRLSTTSGLVTGQPVTVHALNAQIIISTEAINPHSLIFHKKKGIFLILPQFVYVFTFIHVRLFYTTSTTAVLNIYLGNGFEILMSDLYAVKYSLNKLQQY